MAVFCNNNRNLVLPQEICGIICQDPALARCDLHALCAVSRAFRDEAERLLYVSARLRGTRGIKSFCIAVIRRPHLALRIRKIMLLMPPQMDLEADDLARITKALRFCANLKDLYTLKDDSRAVSDKPGDAVHTWILEGHAFSLKRFVNNYFQPQVLAEFLKFQPSLETLVVKCRGPAEICDAPLPMLKNLDSSAATIQEFSTPSSYKRKIERLQFELLQSTDVEELATFVALTRFSDTLKSLSVLRKDGQNGLDIAVLLACVAQQLPDLKYLRIIDYTTKMETLHVPFLPFPMQFTKIETLILVPPKRIYSPNGLANSLASANISISSFNELRTEGGRRTAVQRIMAVLATLKRLVLENLG
ncbi:hypothetical protein BDZ97DRAFT_1797420 [Flammula alnicola]|nr:hypothetical protein BDZ97DRAFT_1797420 [Flammula alnicola]